MFNNFVFFSLSLKFNSLPVLPDLMSTIDPHEKIFIGMRALLGIVAVRENLREVSSIFILKYVN